MTWPINKHTGVYVAILWKTAYFLLGPAVTRAISGTLFGSFLQPMACYFDYLQDDKSLFFLSRLDF